MLNVETDLFQAYAFYTAILVFKMMIMSFLTARQRFKTMTFISSEDAKQPGTKVGTSTFYILTNVHIAFLVRLKRGY